MIIWQVAAQVRVILLLQTIEARALLQPQETENQPLPLLLPDRKLKPEEPNLILLLDHKLKPAEANLTLLQDHNSRKLKRAEPNLILLQDRNNRKLKREEPNLTLLPDLQPPALPLPLPDRRKTTTGHTKIISAPIIQEVHLLIPHPQTTVTQRRAEAAEVPLREAVTHRPAAAAVPLREAVQVALAVAAVQVVADVNQKYCHSCFHNVVSQLYTS